MTEADREYFEEVSSQDALGVVVFTAPWCGFCHSMEKVCHSVMGDFPRVHFCRVDIDKHKGIAEQYAVKSVPTTLAFCGGRVVSRRTGLMKKSELFEMLSECQRIQTTDSLI